MPLVVGIGWRLLAPLPDGQICKTFVFNETYYIGLFGSHTAVVVKCDMGTAGRDAALAVCTSALLVWRPRAVIMVGIAFGKDPKQQHMCDVLVANSLIPYELAKVGPRYVPRSPHPPTNALLLNRFTNATDWSFRCGRSKVRMRIGPLLTGEKVIDNPTVKAKLFRLFPHAIGGEMEGAGIFAAADRVSTPWILVKAICDWGDGTKSRIYQERAAAAAASLVQHVLTERACLDALPTPALLKDSDPFCRPVSALHVDAGSETGLEVAHSPPLGHLPPALADQGVTTVLRVTHTSCAPEILNTPATRGHALHRPPARINPALLTRLELHALRLIASAPVRLPSVALKALFPRVDWKRAIRALRRKRVVDTLDPQPLGIARSVIRHVFEEGTNERYETMWLKRLEALREHSDTAALLGLLHLKAKRFNEAVEVLTNIAEGLEPGSDNSFYRNTLKHLMVPRLLRHLTAERQVHLLNAYALCISRDGEYEASLPYYERLLRLSRKSRNAWGVGQAYINSGVSNFYLGNVTKARRCYELAVAHAQRTRDRWLQARALHNLGATISEESPEKGAAFIKKSLALKLEHGDVEGVAGTFLGQGNIHAHAGRHRAAIDCYLSAVKLARKVDLRHRLGLALSNMGSAHVDLGEPDRALPFYREARQIGERERFRDVRRFALQGEAVAYSRLDKFRPAMLSFFSLVELHKPDLNRMAWLAALHDAGVMAARAGEPSRAKKALASALRLARRERDQVWIFRCHVAMAILAGAGNNDLIECRLRAAAASTSACGQQLASNRLWLVILERLIEQRREVAVIERAAKSALSQCSRTTGKCDSVEAYKRLCVWRRERQEPLEALKYAKLVERHAAGDRKVFDRITAIDEQACCYQRVGKPRLAEGLHRKALALAEQADDVEALAAPLVNLVSLLRNTGRLQEAHGILGRAETLATRHDDVSLAAIVAENMALVLADSGKAAAARRLLESWRRKTATLGIWPEHVMALRRLANLAHARDDLERADDLYKTTLTEAARHDDATQRDIAEDCVSLLTERMRRALMGGERVVSERIFERAKRLAKKYSLTLSYRDLLLVLGDAQWRRGARYYASGTRAYLAAFAEVPDVGVEEVLRLNGQAGRDLALQFCRIPLSFSLPKVEKVVRDARDWLRAQSKGELSEEVESLICWPLVTGLRVAELVRSGQPPTPDVVGQLVAKDFTATWTQFLNRDEARQRPAAPGGG